MFTLGRKIDIKYPTNQIILGATLILSIIAYFTTGKFSLAIQMGVSLFLTWALVREIDCKREYAAILAAFLTLINLFIPFKVGLGTLFLMILLLRFVNQITGKKKTVLDFIAIMGLAFYVSFSSQNSIYIFLVFLAILIDLKDNENRNLNLIFLAISFVLYWVLSIGFDYFVYFGEIFTNLPMVLFYGISLLIYFIFIFNDPNKATLDDMGENASVRKILKGQMYFGFAIFLLLVFSEVALGTIVVFSSAVYGFIIYGLFHRFRNKSKAKL